MKIQAVSHIFPLPNSATCKHNAEIFQENGKKIPSEIPCGTCQYLCHFRCLSLLFSKSDLQACIFLNDKVESTSYWANKTVILWQTVINQDRARWPQWSVEAE